MDKKYIKNIVCSWKPFLIYHDDEDETALVLPGEFMTIEKYTLMKKEASGDVALMCHYPDIQIFWMDYLSNSLLQASEHNEIVDTAVVHSHAWPTLDLKISKTGSADLDKVNVIKKFSELVLSQNSESFFKEFVIPGHVRTYLAVPGLLSERIGHTELGVYLSKYAGLSGVVAMATLRNKSKWMPLNFKQTEKFSKQKGYPFLCEKDILQLYKQESLPKKISHIVPKKANLLDQYKKMFEIREFEKLLQKLFVDKKIRWSYHLAIWQEATGVALGNCLNFDSWDSVFVSHRWHHVALGMGIDYKAFFFECIGDKRGINNGRAWPMHFFYKTKWLISANGIVAANSAISAWLALANKYNKNNNVVVNVIWDWSLDEGIVHETLTMVKILEIPLIILCENNFYSQTTLQKDHLPYPKISKAMRDFYNIEVERIEDGTDVIILQNRLQNIVDYVRRTRKPVFVEIHTYRFCGHSMSDKEQLYRDKELDKKRAKRDPLVLLKEHILRKNKKNKEKIKLIESKTINNFKKLKKQIWTT